MPTGDRAAVEWRELALLWAGRRCGALNALATTAGTADAVADEADIDPQSAERLVAALEARGFLAHVDGEYEPTNRLLGFLTKTDLRSIGRLPAELDAFDRWVALPETLAGADPPEPADALRNELGRERAADAARVRSEVTTAVHAAPDGDRVVVLGDGGGSRAVEFADRGWSVTLYDTSERIEAVEPLLSHESVGLQAGDPTDADLPPCDLVVGIGVLQRYDDKDARDIVAAASDAAPAAVFIDAFQGVTDDASLKDIDRLAAGRGAAHDAGAVRSWLADGYGDVRIEAVPSSPHAAAVGRVVE
ncbi:hypothetical protein [Natronomonas amylolytica]|uniref:hypothetical protein n=1 Tax=Natronomonas amylolytica TaxID=3108498 RepID=UPI00300B10CC